MMCRIETLLVLLTLLAGFASAGSAEALAEPSVCFSPPLPGGCDPTKTIVTTLEGAQHQVLIQAYEFTSAPIAKAVVDAKRRGLDVRVILDKAAKGGGYSAATFLEHSGVPVSIDYQHAIAHNKVMIVDGQTVITGSFNFTKAAEERNAENIIVIDDSAIAALYTQNWNSHAAHSVADDSKTFRHNWPGTQTDPNLLPVAPGSNPQGSGSGVIAGGGATSAPPDGAIVGNRRSHIYAWPGCGTYDTMAPGNRVVFPSAQAAQTAGYRAAHNCP